MANSLNQELLRLKAAGVSLPRNPQRAATAAQDMRKLVSEGSLQTDIGNLYGPKDPLKQKNDDLIQAFQSSRDRTARMRRHGSSSGGAGGSDVFSAIPRFYDPMEYWDLSGLPWNMADEGHRHKLHKWLRLYYATHSLIATLVDIFTRFPLAGMYLHSKDSQLTGFYEELFMNNLDYGQFLVDFGREYWCIGEAFPLGSFDEGLGVWEHEELINPEDIRIENFPLLASKQLKVIPPEYLKRLVSTKSPQKEYKQLEIEYPDLIPYLRRGEPFPVSDVLLKQVAFTANPWDDHGTPILLRGLRTLMHQEKLLASQDAIAERLYSPLILAKLGTQDLGDGAGPWIPSQENLSQFRDDMDIALASDFRLIVHHFALEIENVFGREQVPDLNNDFDRIERQLMQVFGVNPSLLSAGSNSQPYASSALQAEFMNQMLKTYQNYLKQHYRDRALVVAEAQEHFDFEKRGDTRIPIFEEVLVRDEETGVERIEKRRKLLIPDLEMSVLDMRDEATERAFLMQLRSMGVPISDGNLMVGVNFKYKDSLDEMKQEMIQKTVAQQEAKLEAYQILETRGLPIPPDLAAEVAAGTTGGGSGGGMDIGGPGGSGAGPGPGGPGPGGPPGSPIVMPDAPEGVPGGGPPVTGPIEGGPPGPVPEISNERRKGLQYNTKTRHEVKASNGETESIIERLPKAKKVLSFPIVYEDFEDKEEILDLGRRSETTTSRLQDGPAASPGVPGP